ncbi:CRS2-associated factor 2, mitochondrial-like [Eucalyptus grandis]|uniref:CRS2-associated factor 2, mitochondrial-like n=1 Tax=Eucalyptus grandis TaxID=71139 RepID=UPI00192EB126|nr:CRS2-associated factor 2, mitochondrial-like [Eucalyptus grandis]
MRDVATLRYYLLFRLCRNFFYLLSQFDSCHYFHAGKGGVTHNMLDDIHNHWKRAEAVRIKSLGVPTLDMDNVCFHLEDKSGGKIIYRNINILLLYRGRHYDLKQRPVIPLILWKLLRDQPSAPIYPKLVKNVAEGLTFEETKEMRNRGLNSPPLTKLTRNVVYVNVVEKVREAFKTEEVVRLDCKHVGTSDCKLIGVKLRDLVPCVPILFKDEQIILWRGKRDTESTSTSHRTLN